MTSIDKAIPIPLYYQLKQLLLERIDQGIYPKGEPIASEFEMMEEFEGGVRDNLSALRPL